LKGGIFGKGRKREAGEDSGKIPSPRPSNCPSDQGVTQRSRRFAPLLAALGNVGRRLLRRRHRAEDYRKLKDGTFMRAFKDKGRMSSLVASISVHIILDDKTALYGAARCAFHNSR